MRRLILLAAVLSASAIVAEAKTLTTQAAEGSTAPTWSRLQSAPAGVPVQVKAKGHSANCDLKSVTETTLVCGAETFARADVKSVKVRHRGRSTLAGLGIGAGAGAVVGFPQGRSGSFVGHGAAAVIFAIPGAIIGAIVGASTDFTHSNLYKAP